MKQLDHNRHIPAPARVGLIILATVIGLVLALTIATAQQQPDFSTCYKTSALLAKPGDVITYTIVVVNTGGAVQNVILSDPQPDGVTFVPGSCKYDDGDVTWTCDSLDKFWTQNFSSGKRITTTLAATVTQDSHGAALVNRANLDWDSDQQEMIFTTTVLLTIPDFGSSYKTRENPQIVESGDMVTYTIVAVNTGDPVANATLSDPLPSGVSFAGCSYIAGATGQSCTPPLLWEQDLASGARITTTLVVTVETSTLNFPLRNCAYLSWDVLQEDMCSTTMVNSRVYLPLTMRNYAPFVNGDFGDQMNGWSAGGLLRVEAVTELYPGAPPPSITGTYAARLGGDDSVYPEGQVPVGHGALWQTFSVPDSPNPEINIRYRVATHDVVYGTSTSRYFDGFEVAIDQSPWEIDDSSRDAAGCNQSTPVPSVIDVSSGGLAFCDGNRTDTPTGTRDLYESGWQTVTLRLGPALRSKNITLYLANFNRVDHYWNTWTYVDWVSANW